jgi:hypothetical protein
VVVSTAEQVGVEVLPPGHHDVAQVGALPAGFGEVGIATRHVDHHVEVRAEFISHACDLLRIGAVTSDWPHADLRRGAGELAGVAPGDDHGVVAGPEPGGHGLAESTPAAGDQHELH